MSKNGLTAQGIIFGIALFLFPFIDANQLFYGATNAKYFYVLGVTSFFAIWWAIEFIRGKVCAGALSWEKIKRFLKRPLVIVSTLLLLVYFIAGIFGVNPARSFWSEIFRSSGIIFLSYTFLLAFISSTLLNAHDWKFVRRSFVLSSTLFSALYFLGTEGIIHLGGKFFESYGLSFGNPTFAATFVLLGIFFTLIEIFESGKTNKAKYFFSGFFLLQLLSPILFNLEILKGLIPIRDIITNPALILGSAKASSAAVLVGLVFLLLYWLISTCFKDVKKRKNARVSISVIFSVGALFSLVLLFVPGSFIQNKYSEISTGARPIVWQGAIEAVKERPLFGWGPENFNFAYYGKRFDNRLYSTEGHEVWFDRAHNVTIDTAIEIGLLGLLVMITWYVFLARVFWQAHKENKISTHEALIFSVMIFANFLQLQTSFNTNITYTIFAALLGYGLFLERDSNALDAQKKQKSASENVKTIRAIAGLSFIGLIIFSSIIFLFQEKSRQSAIVSVFKTQQTSKSRVENAEKVLKRESSVESMRLLSASLIKGVLQKMGKGTFDQSLLPEVQKELHLYENAYYNYLKKSPSDYRAHVNLAYLHLFQTISGENRLSEAKELLKDSYALSPSNPLTYMIDALAHLYEGDFKNAKRLAEEGIALNPDIEVSKRVLAHIEAQEKTFPEITFLALENI